MTPAQILATARVILLDFDGPVCHLFAGTPAHTVANQLRQQLTDAGTPLPENTDTSGPTELCAAVMRRHRDQAATIEALLAAAETRAAHTAEPTPGCRQLLTAARAARRPVVIVSNNAPAAIRAYLDRHQLAGHIAGIVGRPPAAPERMKPDPWPLHEAARHQGVPAVDGVLIGDSVTDVQAAHAAGSASIGYANKPGKREQFQQAGASAIVTDMHELAEALGHTPAPGHR